MAKKSQNFTLSAGDRVKLLISEYNKAHPDKKITQRQIAEEILFSQATSVNEKLNGKRTITTDDAIRLGKHFGVNYEWILGKTKYRTANEKWEAETAESVEILNSFKEDGFSIVSAFRAYAEHNGISISINESPHSSDLKAEIFRWAKATIILKKEDKLLELTQEEFRNLVYKVSDLFKLELDFEFERRK